MARNNRVSTNIGGGCSSPSSFFRWRRARRYQASAAAAVAAPEPEPRSASKLLPLLASWTRPRRLYSEKESFFPFPKITFLLDKPTGLFCQICRESCCTIEAEPRPISDTAFSILPCGHAAGSLCLQKWLKVHSCCPFCRLQLTYPGCGHKIPARVVTQEGVHLLPRTLADAGSIPPLCADCNLQRLKTEAEARFQVATVEFQVARQRLAASDDPHDEDDMLLKKDEFENAMRDGLHAKRFTALLNSW